MVKWHIFVLPSHSRYVRMNRTFIAHCKCSDDNQPALFNELVFAIYTPFCYLKHIVWQSNQRDAGTIATTMRRPPVIVFHG